MSCFFFFFLIFLLFFFILFYSCSQICVRICTAHTNTCTNISLAFYAAVYIGFLQAHYFVRRDDDDVMYLYKPSKNWFPYIHGKPVLLYLWSTGRRDEKQTSLGRNKERLFRIRQLSSVLIQKSAKQGIKSSNTE